MTRRWDPRDFFWGITPVVTTRGRHLVRDDAKMIDSSRRGRTYDEIAGSARPDRPGLTLADQVADLRASLKVWRSAGDDVGARLDAVEHALANDATGALAAMVHVAGTGGTETLDTGWWRGLDAPARAQVAAAWHDDTLSEADVVPLRRLADPRRLCGRANGPSATPGRSSEPEPIGDILPGVIRTITNRDPDAPQWAHEFGGD